MNSYDIQEHLMKTERLTPDVDPISKEQCAIARELIKVGKRLIGTRQTFVGVRDAHGELCVLKDRLMKHSVAVSADEFGLV